MNEDDNVLSVTQASELTGTPVRTIRWAILHNKLPAQKLGTGFYIINRHDLNTWHTNRQP